LQAMSHELKAKNHCIKKSWYPFLTSIFPDLTCREGGLPFQALRIMSDETYSILISRIKIP
ncbi:MAG: hypothetical protein KAK04_06195, partial [Cyclobacteriaceae bacterium]|nr:hypothetical protein [Cyclobacteriaceae bacterium]